MTEMIEAEAVEVTGQEIELRPAAPVNLFRTEDPNEIVARATETADALARVIDEKNLYVMIRSKKHVRVEGWTLLGTMLGVFAVCVDTWKVEDGWMARVEARTLAGAVVGAAEAECLRSEKSGQWKTSDDYAVLSMAQTRATSKALRQPLGFVMTLAGFDPTPSEEAPRDDGESSHAPAPQPSGPRPVQKTQTERLGALLTKLETEAPKQEGQKSYREDVAYFVDHSFGVSPTELTEDQFDLVIEEVERWVKDEALPIS